MGILHSVQRVEYTRDDSHTFIAGICFTYGHEPAAIVIGDVQAKTVVASYRMDDPATIDSENVFLTDVMRSWNVTAWRFESAPPHLMLSVLKSDWRAYELQKFSGVDAAYGHKCYGQSWFQDAVKLLDVLIAGDVHLTDRAATSALYGLDWRESSSGYRLVYPEQGQSLVVAALLAVRELTKPPVVYVQVED